MSVPERYGGSASGGVDDYLGMVIATEELSRVSLGVGGSLITRPEILTRALLVGGTEEQRVRWLPRIARGETMVAVAVTEPDAGSDLANIRLRATPVSGGYVINGVKTWSTFAARAEILLLLARTELDPGLGHQGLSLFVVPKDHADGRGFVLVQSASEVGRPTDLPSGRLEGRPIDTIGYRGMHSYELSVQRLVGIRRLSGWRRPRAGPRLLSLDGSIREWAPSDRSARDRCHASSL